MKVDDKIIRSVSPGVPEREGLAQRFLDLGGWGRDVFTQVFMFPAIEGAQTVAIVVTTGATDRIEKEVDPKLFALR